MPHGLKEPKKVKIPKLKPKKVGRAATTKKLLKDIEDRQSTDSNQDG